MAIKVNARETELKFGKEANIPLRDDLADLPPAAAISFISFG